MAIVRQNLFKKKDIFRNVFSNRMFYPRSLLIDGASRARTIRAWPGGGTWVFRGAHTFVIKIKKYP